MGDDIPRDYDTEYTKPVGWEGGRLRIGHDRDPEKPKAIPRFVVQLEYFRAIDTEELMGETCLESLFTTEETRSNTASGPNDSGCLYCSIE